MQEVLLQLKEARAALNWSREKFRAVFDQAPFSIQIFNLDGSVLLYNQASRRLWGLSDEFVESFIMTEYNVFTDPILIEQGLVPIIKKAFTGEVVEMQPMKYDPASIGKPGRYRWVEPLLYPLRDSSGAVLEVVLIHSDITKQRDAQDERDHLMDELINERNRLEDFISIASHELRTPLTSLNLQMEVIRSIVKTPKEKIDYDNLMRFSQNSLQQLERLSRLVDEMLDISRMSSGKLRLNTRPTNFCELTEEVLARFSDQLKQLGISLEVSCTPVVVNCDPFRMDQVITNLISNAIRYGEHKPIFVELKKSGAGIQLRVRDQGLGVAPEDHERIFKRFERVAHHDIGGMGLGLYISREIVKEHGGSISVESELGQGATFIVELPL